jgi:uncharacterized PurR-regulated membrane protein YhhQ (DUF165 family)
MTYLLIGVYLAAIIAANLTTSHFGPEASIYNAFFLIGLNLTTRDKLHDLWGRNRFRNMALLILAGSALSFAAAHLFAGAAPPDIVARIALASAVAFAVAEGFDAVAYQVLRERPWLERANTSNFVGAFLDSAIFVAIAFGWTWEIIFAQFCAKVAGGFVWSLVIGRIRSGGWSRERRDAWAAYHAERARG